MRKSSFSLVRDDESDASNKSNSEEEPEHNSSDKQFKYPEKLEKVKLDDDSGGNSSPEMKPSPRDSTMNSSEKATSLLNDICGRKSTFAKPEIPKIRRTSSDSDLDDSEREEPRKQTVKEYDPSLYENLDVNEEIKELFQYIVKYMPQKLTLDYKFKPFIPDYLPAVGDIDAFLKVIPPDNTLFGESFDLDSQQLGLSVLDEPATKQSDPALLLLQLRASSLGVPQETADIVVKKLEKVDKNQKAVEKWMKDISDLHKSKSSPVVHYSEPMPDIDDLMQEWSEEMENRLKEHGFPTPEPSMTLTEYAELVCDIFQIPTTKNKIHSLHVLFSLYASVKSLKFYRPTQNNLTEEEEEEEELKTDQLVLD